MNRYSKIEFKYESEKVSFTYPVDGPMPHKDDEITFNGNYGIVEKCTYYVTTLAYEVNIIVNSITPLKK